MPLVSRADRSHYLQTHHPVLFNLCVEGPVPTILSYRCDTTLPFCYGRSSDGAPIPASWDTQGLRVVPLWENATALVAIRCPPSASSPKEEFVRIDFEDPNDVLVISSSVQGLFAYVFYFLIESSEGPGTEDFKEIERLASDLGFKALGALAELAHRLANDSDYEALWAYTRSI